MTMMIMWSLKMMKNYDDDDGDDDENNHPGR